ncbi:MAG: hypothetical protein WAU32_12015 [Thermoanaerobaculia bacterium]
MTAPRDDATELLGRIKAEEARDREKKEFFELADRLARSSDASEQARLKEELARRTFGE